MRATLSIWTAAITLVLAVGCKGDRDSTGEPAEQPPASEPAPSAGAPGDDAPAADDNQAAGEGSETGDSKPTEIDEETMCMSSCLLLTRHSLAELSGGKYCDTCGKHDGDACQLPWPVIDRTKCGEWDVMRNCIYAAHGYSFKKPKWRDHFGTSSWYRPRADFSDNELSKTERANIKHLKERAKACRAEAATGKTVLQKLQGDFDGDGKPDEAEITTEEVIIGKLRAKHGMRPDEFSDLTAGMQDVDTGDKRVEIQLTRWGDDDDAVHRFASIVDGELKVSNEVSTWGRLQFKGDGSFTVSESNCGQTTVRTFALAKSKVNKVNEDKTGAFDESQCAACPYVYVEDRAGKRRFVGEILRDVRGSRAKTTQSLVLRESLIAGKVLRVRVEEEKQETTYIDDVHLVVGTTTLRPANCTESASHCSPDGRYLVLNQGDHIDLEFELPEATPADDVMLWATGYYVPLAD